MAKPFQPYHYAWLSVHPNRNKDWLRFMMKAGFDIHHMDGDHDNNDPSNLVLIEHTDHMRLHGMAGTGRMKMNHVTEAAKQARRKKFLAEGKLAYETALAKRETATTASGIWVCTARETKLGAQAINRAKLWATENGLEWPLWRKAV